MEGLGENEIAEAGSQPLPNLIAGSGEMRQKAGTLREKSETKPRLSR
jgi:hypothetical protein